ncbi:ABC transporter ATP-binding protein [Prevotella sp. HMSC073D09]|uniref:peptidase domain-containing ABC transporter n=1 Tax=Prevotella sp. HMSC073D09 TaxID=1739459 RepID=UPI0008A1AB1B|nr:peptidase domain-containing ABC transporter [Prevotella sp. HMSC073D09]OFQ19647.1 ABC transporter ATP-binding protein [Prevotella sp. HMSC073D09]
MKFCRFPVEYQMDSHDCGPASLKIIAKHFGKYYSLQYLRDRCGITKEGVSLHDISVGAENIGLRTLAVKCDVNEIVNSVSFPAIIFWNNNHFVVVFHADKKHIYVSDPARGRVKYSHETFKQGWYQRGENQGVLLAVEPTVDFKETKAEKEQKRNSFLSILKYFTPYSRSFALIFVIMLIVTALQGVLPFISKAVIDVGIKTSDVNFINMILIGNISILLSVMVFNVLRDWILLHITARVNIALISDYLIKLMNLPVTFFENKLMGDILQRAQDHERIRSFIMNNSLSLIFSMLTFVVFAIILLIYNVVIFLIFLAGSALYVGWVLLFLNVRKKLDWEYFELLSRNQSYWVETVSAIQDVKINNYEKQRRWKWEEIQARLYHVNKRVLAITNMQNLGAQFIESIKNMGIVFFCAVAVINGDITFGVMISTQFIIGMLNGPLSQFISFVMGAQYAKISFLRINEIRQLEDEEELLSVGNTCILPNEKSITLSNVHFQYSANSPFVLKGIYLHIPENKVTAIVGGSGCGKSTLLKLLVRLYKPSFGDIKMDTMNVDAINLRQWRNLCGVVMQDGKVFSDTIINNIVLDADRIDYDRLHEACKIAQLEEEINAMPNGFDTTVGETGRGLSGGQKQRLLIARALYRNPKMLFLDEATNALDTINERKIVDALNNAFEHRTVVVIAHRLSTIQNADQIVVLDKGYIVEVGTHKTLMENKKRYYELVSSQTQTLP